MAYLIGVDEAGYGPRLGPLVISGTLWQVPDGQQEADLYELLGDVVCRQRPADREGRQLRIADSKQLYTSGGSLRELERGVLVACRLAGLRLGSWRELWEELAPEVRGEMAHVPWYADYDLALPRDTVLPEIERDALRLGDVLRGRQVRFLGIRSRVLLAARFNDAVDRLGSKGTVLTDATLQLVQQLLAPLENQPILVQCDKHGGRSRYHAALQQRFADTLVEVWREGSEESRYRWGPAERRVEIRFTVRGERFLPSALASMASKYLRELAMQAFNAFWCRRLPGLDPTAGYPVDAERFRSQIQQLQQDLQIPDRWLWRSR